MTDEQLQRAPRDASHSGSGHSCEAVATASAVDGEQVRVIGLVAWVELVADIVWWRTDEAGRVSNLAVAKERCTIW